MNCILNEKFIVKEYEFQKPLLCEIDFLGDICVEICNNNYYHTFRFTLEYNNNFTIKGNNEIYKLTISNIAVGSYEINKKLTIAQRNGFNIIQIKKLTIKFYATRSQMTIRYYLKHHIPIMHRQFFTKISQKKIYIQKFCTNLNKPFQYACRQW